MIRTIEYAFFQFGKNPIFKRRLFVKAHAPHRGRGQVILCLGHFFTFGQTTWEIFLFRRVCSVLIVFGSTAVVIIVAFFAVVVVGSVAEVVCGLWAVWVFGFKVVGALV